MRAGECGYLAGPSSPIRAVSTFEADFRSLREERGLSLDDLHEQTRVPVDVLRRFESGALLADSAFNDVYLKAFVKSYSKAVGIPQDRALRGFEAARTGGYSGELLEGNQQSRPAPLFDGLSDAARSTPTVEAPPAEPEPTPVPPAREDLPPSRPPAVEAFATDTRGEAEPPPERRTVSPAPTLSPSRVGKPVVPQAARSFDKNWGTIGGIAALLLALCAAAVWFLVIREDGPETEPLDLATEAAVEQTDLTDAPETPSGPRLQTPITVRVLAEGDGLQSFRVTQDRGDRFPVWVEPGDAREYAADSVLVLWGEGDAFVWDDAQLELQGMQWRPAAAGPVEITLRNGQALLDSLAAAGAPPAAPAPAAE